MGSGQRKTTSTASGPGASEPSSAANRYIGDPEVLKGLAHPVRLRLYRLLAHVGPATVGTLAKKLGGADPGLVSYHLRELARRGFIEDVPELARDRRERWWRLIPGATSWNSRDFDTTPDGRAVASTVKAQTVMDEFERVRRFEQTRESWAPNWQDAAISSDSFLQLTPDELGQLSAELHEVLARWATHGRQARSAGDNEGREPVFLFLHAFPERL